MAETLVELVARINADASSLKKALADSESATAKAAKSISQKLGEIGHKMTDVGKQMSMKLTAPIVGLGAAAFKMSGDFDLAFRKTNVMLGASAEEAINYKKRISEISSATGIAATDVAAAFYTIVSAGHRGADSLDILEVAMKGVVGGAANAESTVEALTKAMNVFELEGIEGSSKAMDIFFGIVDSGLLSFEQMANSFPRAASNAAGLGVSIEETGAALATLTKVLGSTEQAATATDAMLRLLISPSEAMVDLFNEWGVKSGPEAIEKFGGLTGVLAKLKDATNGEVTAIRELFASDEAMKGILPLLTSSYNDYGQAVFTVTNSQGRASEAFQEMAQGPGFQLQQSITKIANASVVLGDTLAKYLSPILQRVTDGITNVTTWFDNLSSPMQTLIVVSAGIVAAIGPMLIIFGQMAIGLGGLITLFKTLKIVQVIATAAQWLWNAALTANPIGLIIVAIAALIAIGIALWQNWDTISKFLADAWDNIKIAFASAVKFIINSVLLPFVEIWGKQIGYLVLGVGNLVGVFNHDLGQSIKNVANGFINARQTIGNWTDGLIESAQASKNLRQEQSELAASVDETTAAVDKQGEAWTASGDKAVSAITTTKDTSISAMDATKTAAISAMNAVTQTFDKTTGTLTMNVPWKEIPRTGGGGGFDDSWEARIRAEFSPEVIADYQSEFGESWIEMITEWKAVTDISADQARIYQERFIGEAEGRAPSGTFFDVRTGEFVPYSAGTAATGFLAPEAQEPVSEPAGNEIPRWTEFAHGGIVRSPTIGLIGEAGDEAIMPLDEIPRGVTVTFTQPVFFDREDQMNKFVDMIRKGIQRQDRLRFGGAYSG